MGYIERWDWQTHLQGSSGDADIEKRLVDTEEKEKVEWVGRVSLKHKYCHMQI